MNHIHQYRPSQVRDQTIYPQVAYFYMPSSEGRPAEIIEIMNIDSRFIQVPMREEDVELESFFQRNMTEVEIYTFGTGQQVWQIFNSWGELAEDHVKFNVDNPTLSELFRYKNRFSLPEGMAA
ncbi:hypothetical protein [Pontibacter roseus]|uniref:hypothetical protein n=1 Tax=Pontibacter roseus TaxID=336989 RepID=UPI0012F95FF5|nr:hypothetical protein [Pontibacter roseus]